MVLFSMEPSAMSALLRCTPTFSVVGTDHLVSCSVTNHDSSHSRQFALISISGGRMLATTSALRRSIIPRIQVGLLSPVLPAMKDQNSAKHTGLQSNSFQRTSSSSTVRSMRLQRKILQSKITDAKAAYKILVETRTLVMDIGNDLYDRFLRDHENECGIPEEAEHAWQLGMYINGSVARLQRAYKIWMKMSSHCHCKGRVLDEAEAYETITDLQHREKESRDIARLKTDFEDIFGFHTRCLQGSPEGKEGALPATERRRRWIEALESRRQTKKKLMEVEDMIANVFTWVEFPVQNMESKKPDINSGAGT